MATIASLVVQIGADVADLNRKFDQAEQRAQSFGSKITTGLKVLGASAAFGLVAQGFSRIVDAADEIDTVASRINETAENVQRLQAVASAFDTELGAVTSAIQEMQAKLGEGKLQDTLGDLNISVAQFQSLSPAEQFLEVASALGKIEDPAKRAALAKEALGKAAKGVSGALRENIKDAGDFVVMSNTTVAAIDSLSRGWESAKRQALAFGAQVLALATGLEAYARITEKVKPPEVARPGLGPEALPLPGLPFDTQAMREIETTLTKSAEKQIELTKAAAKHAEKVDALNQSYRETHNWIGVRLIEAEEQRLANLDKFDAEYRKHLNDVGVREIEAHAAKLAAIDKEGAEYRKLYNEIGLRQMEVAAAAMKTGTTISQSLKAAFTNLPQVLMAAFTGGGNVGQAVGGLFGGSIFGAESGLMKSITGSLKGALGGIGGAIGSILPGLGTLAGGFLGEGIGALVGKLFGGEGKKVNDLRDQFIAAAGGLHALNVKALEAGLTLDKLLRADKVKAFEAAVRELEASFGNLEADQRRLVAAMDRYGLSIADMGVKFRQTQINTTAAEFIEDFRVLAGAVDDVNVVLDAMAPEVNEFIRTTMAMGNQVPLEMQGIIGKMIDLGLLVDETGEKFTDVSQIPFAASITESLEKIVDKLDRLISKLFGVGDAINTIPREIDVTINGHLNMPDGIEVPGLQHGGLVTRPTLAVVGEAGPELVTPLHRLGGVMGGTVNVTVYAQGAFFRDFDSIQRLAAEVGKAIVNRAELRGRFAFQGAGV